MGKTYKIAVLPGDGTGPEVVAEGLKVLEAAAAKHGFKLDLTHYDLGGERYLPVPAEAEAVFEVTSDTSVATSVEAISKTKSSSSGICVVNALPSAVARPVWVDKTPSAKPPPYSSTTPQSISLA